eukprot:384217_1
MSDNEDDKVDDNDAIQELIDQGFTIQEAKQAISMSLNKEEKHEEADPSSVMTNQLIEMGFNKYIIKMILPNVDDISSALQHIEVIHSLLHKKDENQSTTHMFGVCTQDNKCQDSLNCHQVRRLMNIMNLHINNRWNSIESMDNTNILQILNDYIHTLQEHNDDKQFDGIVSQQEPCNIENCQIFRNNYRHREIETEMKDIANIVSNEILNKIHCYFYHTYDIGYRLSIKEKCTIEDTIKKKGDSSCNVARVFDQSIIQLNNTLRSKKPQNDDIQRDLNRSISKFSQFVVEQKSYESEENAIFDFGTQFTYLNAGEEKDCPFRGVLPKFKSFKEEMTKNSIARLTVQQFNSEYKKAQTHFNSHYRKKHYREMLLEHILSLMIYCNYTQLQYKFSKTYRENEEEHDNFYFLGKFLKLSIHEFGTRILDKTIVSFYHGISEPLSFRPGDYDSYTRCNFAIPLSTSSSFEVACNFACNGLIVEFGDNEWTESQVRYFSVSWISDFSNEHEYLFIQNDPSKNKNGLYEMQINNIWDVESGSQLKDIMKVLRIITGDELPFNGRYLNILTQLVDNKFESLSTYVNRFVSEYFENAGLIGVKLPKMPSFWYTFLGHSQFKWVNLKTFDALYSNLFSLFVRNIKPDTLPLILDDIIAYFCDVNADCKWRAIALYFEECDNTDDLTSKYQILFKSIGFKLWIMKDKLMIDQIKQ